MEKQKTPQRLQSLDALRGFDMFFIMGGATLIAAIANFWPNEFTMWLAEQMDHVKWDGLAHHDTIFPLFLFIAGISFPFSLEKQRIQGKTEGQIYKKIVRRGLTLVLLGIIYNGFLEHWDFVNARYASVLARIGLAWMFGALIFMNTKWKTRAIIVAVILVGYWLLSAFVGAPDHPGADPLTREGCLAGYVDRILLPGKIYYGDYDPEGILSTIPISKLILFKFFKDVFGSKKFIVGRTFPTDKKVIRRWSFFFIKNFCFLRDKSYKIKLQPEINTIKSSVTY